MATLSPLDYEEAMQAMATRNELARMSWKAPSRISPIQSSRRHSARIEKSRSYHPSPRTPNRRNTATSSRHYSTMEDHYRRMMAWNDEEDVDASAAQTYQPTRPVSWHPGTSGIYDSYAYSNTVDASPTSLYLSYQNSPFYHGVGQLNPTQPTWSSYMHGDFNSASGQQQIASIQQEPTSWFDNSNPQQEHRIASTWTEPNEEAARRAREPSVELVALGLYDEPGFTIKIGSKLEEECDPPEFDAEEEDDDEESEAEEELPKVEESKVAQASLPLDMSGRSFFMEPAVNYRNTWWSGLEDEQPQTAVNNVNYGWI